MVTTRDYALCFEPNTTSKDIIIEETVDAGHARYTVDRVSYSGAITTVNGMTVDWTSTKQSVVAMSPNEAEYIAYSEGGKDALYFRHLAGEMLESATGDIKNLPKLRTPTAMYVDNEGARVMAENCINNRKSRHIEVRYHAIRSWVQKKRLNLRHLPGKDNMADMMTKPLGRVLFSRFRDMAGVVGLNFSDYLVHGLWGG